MIKTTTIRYYTKISYQFCRFLFHLDLFNLFCYLIWPIFGVFCTVHMHLLISWEIFGAIWRLKEGKNKASYIVTSVLTMHEGLICLWLGFMTCFMLSLRHERHAANLPPCSVLPPWQSWQPCLPPGWSVCQARCCWWWRGLRTWGCRALGSGCVLQTAAAHLRRPLKCQVERVNNTKSFRRARNSVF